MQTIKNSFIFIILFSITSCYNMSAVSRSDEELRKVALEGNILINAIERYKNDNNEFNRFGNEN